MYVYNPEDQVELERAAMAKQMHTGTQTNFYERGRGNPFPVDTSGILKT